MRAALSMIAALGFLFAGTTAADAEIPGDDDRVVMTAQVIDMSCKVVHDLSGDGHRECAQVCADQGVPLALLAEDGNIYQPVSMEMPSSGDEINQMLRPHAERMVVVEGETVQRAGVNGIIIESVRPAQN